MTSQQSILEQEVTALRAVLLTLEDEHAALLERAPERLQAASIAKAEAVANAIRLEERRRDPDRQSRGPGDARGQESSLDATVARLRAELRQLAGDCRALNDRNGQLIRGQRRRIEGSLNVLRGRPMVPDTYGRDGTGTFSRGPGVPLASY